jgi:hypothetical protein
MNVFKTVLAPNAPWPMYNKPKMPKVRSKPSETDAKFKQWMEKNT